MSTFSKVYLLKSRKKDFAQVELVAFVVTIIFILMGIVAIYVSGTIKTFADEIPSENAIREQLLNKGENSKIFDRNGQLLYTFKDPDRDREYITIDEITPEIIAAVIAIEDQDFYVHQGINYVALVRAAITSLDSRGERLVGGSTITQQLVKQILLTNEQSADRKIREAFLSLIVERDYSKDKILELYLNTANFGGRVQGIRTAADVYFGKSVADITVAEAVYLIAMVQSPGELSPLFSDDKELAASLLKSRQEVLLNSMQGLDKINAYLNTADKEFLRIPGRPSLDSADAKNIKIAAALKESIVVKFFSESIDAPHWVFYVRSVLRGNPYNLSINDLYSGGYRIYTTLDLELNKLGEEKVRSGVERWGSVYGFENSSLVSIDARTGEILAMVGSKGYSLQSDPSNRKFDPKVNVSLSKQTLGSSLKPWVAYLAFNSGRYQPGSMIEDSEQVFYGNYRPKNFDGRFQGEMTITQALLDSRNLPFLKLLYGMGDSSLGNLMKQIGYAPENSYGLASAIGGVDETLLDHTAAYTGFANGGQAMRAQSILKITRANNEVIYNWSPQVKADLNRQAVGQVNAILGNKSYQPGTYSLKFVGNQKLAGKTGTSDGNVDTYYMGYGPKVVTGVWCGNNDNARMSSSALGSTTAVRIWNDYMRGLFSLRPELGQPGSY